MVLLDDRPYLQTTQILFLVPPIAVSNGHKFNESHLVIIVDGEAGKINNLTIIKALNSNNINLYRAQACIVSFRNSLPDE